MQDKIVTFPLIFIEREDNYSVYHDATGTEVFLGHGRTQFTYLVDFDQVDLYSLWDNRERIPALRKLTFTPAYDASVQRAFLDYLSSIVTEPDEVGEVQFCANCYCIGLDDDGHGVGDDEWACTPCFQNDYYQCGRCDEHFTGGLTETMDDHYSVCDSCRDHHYSFCEDCDGYYRDENSGNHDHTASGCCVSPEMGFTVRNDGDPVLANDTRVTVTLPAGTIDTEGVNRIMNHLYNLGLNDLAGLIPTIGEKWQTKDGNFTKRLSKAAHKMRQEYLQHDKDWNARNPGISGGSGWLARVESLKTPPAVLSAIGTIGAEHCRAVDFSVEVTRNLNLDAAEFCHEDSCWWGGYSNSRCALKTNGGYALRTFSREGWGVAGRAWVMPLRLGDEQSTPSCSITNCSTCPSGSSKLHPTFDTLTPDAFVVFNGYGDLEGYNAARIVAHMAGMTYRKIRFACTPMFVNGDSGYLIAPEEIAADYTDGSLNISVDQHSNLYARETEEWRAALLAITDAEKELQNV